MAWLHPSAGSAPLTCWSVSSLSQVKKIYENEKRLQAGEHSLDLLAHDFKKNYNMYIFPVHWQFGQLDQHPADGCVTGRGGASLRAGDKVGD